MICAQRYDLQLWLEPRAGARVPEGAQLILALESLI